MSVKTEGQDPSVAEGAARPTERESRETRTCPLEDGRGRDERPAVLVWRNEWLPRSETFIRDHVLSLDRWRPVLLGLRKLEDGLGLEPIEAPFGARRPPRLLRSVLRRTGHLGLYRSVVRQEHPRLVHAHFGTDGVDIASFAVRQRLPLVVTFHGYDLSAALVRKDAAPYRARLRRLFDQASLLLPVSTALEDELLALGAPREKVQRHHLGIPVRDVAVAAGGEARQGVVFVGRLVARKGVADLLQAVGRLPAPLRNVTVTVVGDGPARAQLEHQARVLELDVRFVGSQPSSSVAQYLAGAEVFCGPSRQVAPGDTEAFGLVFLEAALQGLPVVAYRHGGVGEAVKHGRTGLLVPEGDIDALAASLHRFLAEPTLARTFGEAGRRRVIEKFDIQDRTRSLEQLYDEVVAQHHSQERTR